MAYQAACLNVILQPVILPKANWHPVGMFTFAISYNAQNQLIVAHILLLSSFNRFLMKLFTFLSLIFFSSLFNGVVLAQLFEDFEQGEKSYYAAGYDDLETGEWFFDDALVGNTALDKKNGSQSARIRNGQIAMNFDYPHGLVEVSFYGADFSSDSGGEVQVEYSTDGGSSWSALGDPVSLTPDLTPYSVSASIPGDVRLRFVKTGGNRINIDDVLITDYIETTDHPSFILHINDLAHVSGSTFNFGTTTGEAQANLQIRNGGDQDLVVSDFDIDGPGFTLDAEMPLTLETLETMTYALTFENDGPGEHAASITFYSNDPENETFVIQLVAETLDTSMPIPISEARGLPQGTMVTVAGWVTVASQFAGPVYFQDETAGIAWFNGEIMRDEWLVGAEIGDSIVVTGELGNFNQLLQIVDEESFEVIPEANMEQVPWTSPSSNSIPGTTKASWCALPTWSSKTVGCFQGETIILPVTLPMWDRFALIILPIFREHPFRTPRLNLPGQRVGSSRIIKFCRGLRKIL